jgi:uncharacterized protein
MGSVRPYIVQAVARGQLPPRNLRVSELNAPALRDLRRAHAGAPKPRWPLSSLLLTGRRALLLLAALGVLLSFAPAALAFTPPPLDGPVVDLAGVLGPIHKPGLAARLRAIKGTSGPQIAVLIVPSLEGETVEDAAHATAKAWKLGDAERNDGVLLLVATGERKIRIETGKGIGGALTDAEAAEIIRERIAPALKEGKYGSGIEAGIDAIAHELNSPPTPEATAKPVHPEEPSWVPAAALFLGAFLVVGVIDLLVRRKRMRQRSSSWGGPVSGRFWDGGGDSGGGSNGGGGDSGGGASGDY